jgi:hypothetical protein
VVLIIFDILHKVRVKCGRFCSKLRGYEFIFMLHTFSVWKYSIAKGPYLFPHSKHSIKCNVVVNIDNYQIEIWSKLCVGLVIVTEKFEERIFGDGVLNDINNRVN